MVIEEAVKSSRDDPATEMAALIRTLASGLVAAHEHVAKLEATARSIRQIAQSSLHCVADSRALLRTCEARVSATDGGATSANRLTNRETQVIKLAALGKTHKKIGFELGISVKTVEFHRANAIKKLRLHSRAELVSLAVSCGWLSPQPSTATR